jgi:IrrE N-terminal-like domain
LRRSKRKAIPRNERRHRRRTSSSRSRDFRAKEIELDAIAWIKGAVVNYRPMDGCEARIVGTTRRAVISVNSLSMPERRRFSLAHEIGHWHHHRGRILFCGKDEVCNFRDDALNPER